MTPGLSQEDKKGIKIFVGVAIIFIIMGILTNILGTKQIVDDETLCLIDRPINGHTVFFVDRTDPLNKKQTDWLLREIEKSKQELRFNEKLSIYAITGSRDSFLRALFSRCSPGSGIEANPLYQNPKKIQKKFDESFGEPLAKALISLTQGTKYSTSPIIESINILSNQEDFSLSINNRKLIIVSDMLQNTREFTQYRPYSFREFEKSDYYKNDNPNLDSVEVGIYYVANNYKKARSIQNAEHRKFWLTYFEKTGAKRVELNQISYLPFESKNTSSKSITGKTFSENTPFGESLPNRNLSFNNKKDLIWQQNHNVDVKPKADDVNKGKKTLKSELENNVKSKTYQKNDVVGEIVRRNFSGSLGNGKNISMEICFFLKDKEFRGRFKEENTNSWFSLRGKQAGKEADYIISLDSMHKGKPMGQFTGQFNLKKGLFKGEYTSAITSEAANFHLYEPKENKTKDQWSVSIENLECLSF